MNKRTIIKILVVVALVICAALVFQALSPRPSLITYRNLVLITLDTTRVDYLGFYGQQLKTSPNLDLLAQKAIIFDNAYATAPFTGPSHASILTSKHPSAHGIVFNGHRKSARIKSDSRTLADHLRDAGFYTAAVVSARPLGKKYDFNRGFDKFQLVTRNTGGDNGGGGQYVNKAVKKWLREWQLQSGAKPGKPSVEQKQKDRLFLWVHYFDPHLPYVSPDKIYQELGIPRTTQLKTPTKNQPPPKNLQDAYRAEIYEMDKHIGGLLSILEHFSLLHSTVIAIVADHGEYLGEHGLYDHHQLYEEVLRVPMMIHMPNLNKPIRNTDLVSTIDLAPALLDLLGLEPLPGAQGRNLLVRPSRDQTIAAFSEWRHHKILKKSYQQQPEDFQIGVRYEQYKLIASMNSPDRKMLFNLADDPKEHKNLAESHPYQVSNLESLISSHIKNNLPQGLLSTDDVEMAPDTLEMLKSLGYIQ
jgi:arylsulfatase A-like enzyme